MCNQFCFLITTHLIGLGVVNQIAIFHFESNFMILRLQTCHEGCTLLQSVGVSYRIVSYRIVPYRIVSYRIVVKSYHNIVMLCHVMSCHVMSFRIVTV